MMCVSVFCMCCVCGLYDLCMRLYAVCMNVFDIVQMCLFMYKCV